MYRIITLSHCHIITLIHYIITSSHCHIITLLHFRIIAWSITLYIVTLPHYHIVTLSYYHITFLHYHTVTLLHFQILVFAYFVLIFREIQWIRKLCTFCQSTYCAIFTVFCNEIYLRQVVKIIQMNAINEGFLFKLKWTPVRIALQPYHRNTSGVSVSQLDLIYKHGGF